VLGEQDENNKDVWNYRALTKDHKPEDEKELARIEAAGGKVVNKSGVPRVVWNRPKLGHTGPIRRSTPVDEIPFLAVARALGDLWSYNSKQDIFVVSPEPDLHVYTIDISKQRCLILGTDGAWNVLSPEMAVNSVRAAESNNEKHMLEGSTGTGGHQWQNPSKKLVDLAVDRWRVCKLRADNTSVVVVMLDPPGPPRAQVLRRQRDAATSAQPKKQACNNQDAPPLPPKPKSVLAPVASSSSANKGLSIISRFPNSKKPEEASGKNLVTGKEEQCGGRIVHDNIKTEPTKVNAEKPSGGKFKPLVTTPQPSSLPCSEFENPTIQVNEVSSSEVGEVPAASDSSSRQFVSSLPSPAGPRPRKSLSRELASLALDSPAAASQSSKKPSAGRRSAGAVALPRRRGRSIDGLAVGEGNESDEENVVAPERPPRVGALVPVGKLEAVEAKCDALNNKIKMMEKKVVNRTELLTAEVRALRQTMSSTAVTTPTRVLRSRNGEDVSNSPGSGVKRKRGEGEARAGGQQAKRERTTTWAGRTLRQQKSVVEKVTRSSRKVAGPPVAPPTKGRRSLNILTKK